jgi:hypothetical protein
VQPGDDAVLHVDLDVHEGVVAAGLAHFECGLVNVLAGTDRLEKVGARGVDVVREVEVLDRHLAGAGATALVGGAALAGAPGPGQHIHPILVFGVLGLALDGAQFEEHVDCHGSSPFVAAL